MVVLKLSSVFSTFLSHLIPVFVAAASEWKLTSLVNQLNGFLDTIRKASTSPALLSFIIAIQKPSFKHFAKEITKPFCYRHFAVKLVAGMGTSACSAVFIIRV